MGANFKMSKVGFPIRKSSDQRLFAPSRSISQRTTSFIASYRQGIHQMPLSHLIALICNAHQAADHHYSLGKEGVTNPSPLYCAHCPERPGSHHARHTPKCAVRVNEPEVNQTKPEQAAEGSKICADSAGYAPQALVPLYDVN